MLKSSACARHVIQAESAIFKIYCIKHAGLSIHIENEYLRKGGSDSGLSARESSGRR